MISRVLDEVRLIALKRMRKTKQTDKDIKLLSDAKNLWQTTVDGRKETGSLLYVTSEYIKMSLYYPFLVDGVRDHEHSFESVIESLLTYPESFSIEKFEEFYSQQEREVLSKLQEELLQCTTQK